MKIDNDLIVFDAADFAGLSGEAQAALTNYTAIASTDPSGNPINIAVPIEQFFADRFNDTVRAAKGVLREAKIMSLRNLGIAIVDSPPEVKAKIQPLIDQATVLLGIDAVVAPAEQPPPAG